MCIQLICFIRLDDYKVMVDYYKNVLLNDNQLTKWQIVKIKYN